MEIDFSEKPKELEQAVSSEETPRVHISSDKPIESLYNASTALKDQVSWVKNIGIINRNSEKQRFLEARENEENFQPDFEFKTSRYNPETVLKLLRKLEQLTENIDQDTMNWYGAKELEPEDMQRLFKQIFREYRLYVQLADNIESRQKWQTTCRKLWPMLDTEHIRRAEKRLEKGFKTEDKQEDLDSGDLKSMWQEELDRLGVKWNIEVREVGGCFNIPEDRTVVIADGNDEKRFYSREEARMLTMHELFHVVRAYNGIKVSEESGLPPIIGLHTPFYDATEEGGALYREKQTSVDYPEKGKDYYLRTLAAYYTHEGLGFQEAAEKLIGFGAEPGRAFYLMARNREVLRHHIYLGGYWKHWEGRENVEPLLLGKLNPQWAETLWREVKAEGMLQKPPVNSSDLFDYSFNS